MNDEEQVPQAETPAAAADAEKTAAERLDDLRVAESSGNSPAMGRFANRVFGRDLDLIGRTGRRVRDRDRVVRGRRSRGVKRSFRANRSASSSP